MTVDFINVGQGNAVLVSFPNGQFMLADCGSQKTSLEGKPYKNAQKYINTVVGDKSIDIVVLSHGDTDHVAFIPCIKQAQNPDYLHYVGERRDYSKEVWDWIKSKGNAAVKKCGSAFCYIKGFEGTTNPSIGFCTDESVQVSVLSAACGMNGNSDSIVLALTYGDCQVILPGDADTVTETEILRTCKPGLDKLNKNRVLMAGHHGSAGSTSEEWVDALKPMIGVFSASGKHKTYGHPHCDVVDMLARHMKDDAEEHVIVCAVGNPPIYAGRIVKKGIFLTGKNGDIRFETDGKEYRLMASTEGTVVLAVEPNPFAGIIANPPWADRRRSGASR
ncbi:MBL fold metallo-hydrolase [Saccharothrix sp. BKS2]|uniref:ComEC/Rec2 family competence protein n=1 Tax=Saccharothrix sp. BKS2 TaxID=3064400 RepID=UPI0039ECC50C